MSDSVMLAQTRALLLHALQALGHDGLDEAMEPELAHMLASVAGVDLPAPPQAQRLR